MSDTVDPNSVVVPKATLELYQRSTALLDRMLGHPVHAPDVEKIVADLNPEAVFPGRQAREAIVNPLMGAVDKARAELAERLETESAARVELQRRLDDRDASEAASRQKAEETSLQNRISDIQAKRGFSDETMQKVLERMRENNNPDVDSAAAWVAESIPKPLPSTGHDFLPSQVDVYGSTDPANTAWESLHQDPTKWQTNELRAIVKDPEFLRLGAA